MSSCAAIQVVQGSPTHPACAQTDGQTALTHTQQFGKERGQAQHCRYHMLITCLFLGLYRQA